MMSNVRDCGCFEQRVNELNTVIGFYFKEFSDLKEAIKCRNLEAHGC